VAVAVATTHTPLCGVALCQSSEQLKKGLFSTTERIGLGHWIKRL